MTNPLAVQAIRRRVNVDPTLRTPQRISYTYWPVYYLGGDVVVTSQTPLPLSGVMYSMGMMAVGELKATLQLADPSVRAIDPWALVIPRKTGIVVVRSVTDPTTGAVTSKAMGHYLVWTAPRDPNTGRITITANSVESLWGRRLITGTQAIRASIVPGNSYTFSCQEFTGGSFTFNMTCNWYQGGTFLSTTTATFTPGTGLVTMSANHTAPANANGVVLSIFVNTLTVSSGYNVENVFFGPVGTTTNFVPNNQFVGADLSGWTQIVNTSMTGQISGGAFNTGYVALVSTDATTATGMMTSSILTTNAVVSHPVAWQNVDQQQIAADLLNPAKWSQIPLNAGSFPGWITIDPPTVPTGVQIQELEYQLNSQTNLLQAHQDRAQLANGYEWYTALRVLSGTDPLSANSFREQFILGYPRAGRQIAHGDPCPTFQSRIDGSGNVISYLMWYDGTQTNNIYWGSGSGYQSSAVQALAVDSSQWTEGFLMTEGQYQNTAISDQVTLQAYTNAQIIGDIASEFYLYQLAVRGDLPPTLDTYGLGDDITFVADDWIWPDGVAGDRMVTIQSRIVGLTIVPPEGTNGEKVSVLINSAQLSLLNG